MTGGGGGGGGELINLALGTPGGKTWDDLETTGIVCSQTSCAVLSDCFTDCTCARESAFFV